MICFILGTRPEIIKLSPIIRRCMSKNIPFSILHSNQHYSENMDAAFFSELELPLPNINLGIRESLHGKMVGKMLEKIETELMQLRPDCICVQGDTNTVLAGALAAAKLNIPVVHVEAGLRSYDRSMPEEINRVLTDHLSAVLCAPTEKQKTILLSEGIDRSKVMVTGNTIVDAVLQNMNAAEKKYQVPKAKYILLTIHRPANVDNPEVLSRILQAMVTLSKNLRVKIFFPVHPRTAAAIHKYSISVDSDCFTMMEPISYYQMLVYEKHAQLIATDSGGVQEEACILQVPCITLRDNTERPETVEVGSNLIVGTQLDTIIRGAETMMRKKRSWENPFGDGKAAERII